VSMLHPYYENNLQTLHIAAFANLALKIVSNKLLENAEFGKSVDVHSCRKPGSHQRGQAEGGLVLTALRAKL
jgi:hypothetical protein